MAVIVPEDHAHLPETDLMIFIRRPRPTDQGFIASTWVDSMMFGQKGGPKHPRSGANVLVDKMLDDPAVRLLVASEPAKTDVILGWLCYTPLPKTLVLHYIYVRDRMRHRGIARQLLIQANRNGWSKLAYTMRGPDADGLLEKNPGAVYVPIDEFLGDL